MPLATLVRVGGLAAVLAGVLLVLAELLNLTLDFDTDPVEAATSVTSVIHSVVLMLVVALLLVGLVGLYIRVAEATGRFGLVGFLVALVGTGMVMGVLWDQTFTVPALAQDAPTLLETAPGLGDVRSGIFVCALRVGLALVRDRSIQGTGLPSHSGHTPHGGRGTEQYSAALHRHRFRGGRGLDGHHAFGGAGSTNRTTTLTRALSFRQCLLAETRIAPVEEG